MSRTPLPEDLARAAFEAVKARYSVYFEPTMSEDGTRVISPAWDEPTLVPPGGDYGHAWAIEWEEGPDDWAYQVVEGGSTESDRVLFAAAAEEFGAPGLKAPEPDPAEIPEGVYAEPYASFILALYPA